MENNLLNLAMNLIGRNPNVANSPMNQAYIDTLKSGDNTKGEQLARNLCQTYGISVEEAINRARTFFNL